MGFYVYYRTDRPRSGFSLAEVLASLVIGGMVLVATYGIYSRVGRSIKSVNRKIDSLQLPNEVLQLITEDLYGIITVGPETKVDIVNKYDSRGYATAKMEITKTYYDKKNTEQVFEKIVWVASYDYDGDSNSLVLYRNHSGIAMEDKLLDESRDDWEKELYVPVCDGVTFFRIQVPKGQELLGKWSGSVPTGVMVTISFAEPFVDMKSMLDVPEEEKFTRTITCDRIKKMKLEVTPPPTIEDLNEITEILDNQEEPQEPNGTPEL